MNGRRAMGVVALAVAVGGLEACADARGTVPPVTLGVIQQGDSIGFVFTWGAVLDQRGNPAVRYLFELRSGTADSLAWADSAVTAPGTDTAWQAVPLPGDSYARWLRARTRDDRGMLGPWAASDTILVTRPDTLGPPPPPVTLDTVTLAVRDSVTGAVLVERVEVRPHLVGHQRAYVAIMWSGAARIGCRGPAAVCDTVPIVLVDSVSMRDSASGQPFAAAFDRLYWDLFTVPELRGPATVLITGGVADTVAPLVGPFLGFHLASQ